MANIPKGNQEKIAKWMKIGGGTLSGLATIILALMGLKK